MMYDDGWPDLNLKVDVLESYPAYDVEVMIEGNPYLIHVVGDNMYGMDEISNRILQKHDSDIVDAIEKAIIEYIDMGE